MSKLHAYSSDENNKSKIISYIAGVSYIFTVLLIYIIEIAFRQIGIQSIYILGLFSVIFVGTYSFYKNVLWKKIGNKIPSISGTWIGYSLPNYQKEWPHLAILTIEQNWSEIYIHEDAYFKTDSTHSWDLGKWLGYNESISVVLKESAAQKSNLHILYNHTGEKGGQPNFKGALNLIYSESLDKLTGNYFTNRIVTIENDGGSVEDKEGSQGPVVFKRLNIDIISNEEALKMAFKAGVLEELESEIMKRQA